MTVVASDAAARSVAAHVYLTPHAVSAAPRQAIVELIDRAKHTVEFGIYAFTQQPIADALIAASKRKGVTVRGVADATQALNPKAQAPKLIAAGLDVRLWGDQYKLMHDKVLLVDGDHPRLARLVIGSTNWTGGGMDINNETLVVLTGRDVSKTFTPVIRAQLNTAYRTGR